MEISGRKYLYDVVYGALRQEILEGKIECGMLLPSEREISLRFNVERATVRKALQLLVDDKLVEKKPGVGTKVTFKKRVETLSTSTEHKRVIGFFMSDDSQSGLSITQPFYAELFYQLEQECKKKDYQLIYVSISEETDIIELLNSQDFCPVIFVSLVDSGLIEQAKLSKIPMIIINNAFDGVVSISYDNVSGAYQMMKYLYHMGHRDIAIISASEKYYSTKEKLEGCYRAAKELGLKLKKNNIVYSEHWDYQNGYSCTRDLLMERDKKDYPTAIFAFNDFMAIGVIQALKDLSLRVPEDISVAGFDNIEMLKYMERDLTTMDADIGLLARMLINDNIQQLIKAPESGMQIITPVKLVKGSTVKKIEWRTAITKAI